MVTCGVRFLSTKQFDAPAVFDAPLLFKPLLSIHPADELGPVKYNNNCEVSTYQRTNYGSLSLHAFFRILQEMSHHSLNNLMLTIPTF